MIAHDTDDWVLAAKPLDRGIALLEKDFPTSQVLSMLFALRGECDVFNGAPDDALERTRRAVAIGDAHPNGWLPCLALWNNANAERNAGNLDAAVRVWVETIDTKRGGSTAPGAIGAAGPVRERMQERALARRACSDGESAVREDRFHPLAAASSNATTRNRFRNSPRDQSRRWRTWRCSARTVTVVRRRRPWLTLDHLAELLPGRRLR